jgi:hypothetical protein
MQGFSFLFIRNNVAFETGGLLSAGMSVSLFCPNQNLPNLLADFAPESLADFAPE